MAALSVVGWHASGFLTSVRLPFTHVYWQEFERFSGRLYLRFVALRLVRLYPAHVFMLLAFCVLLAIAVAFGKRVAPDGLTREIVAQILLVHNWGVVDRIRINVPSWSISAEFLAYLLFPLYVTLFACLRSRWALTTSIVVAMALCWFLLAVVLDWPVNTPGAPANIRVVCEFAVGVALFRLWQGGQVASLPRTAIVAALVSAIALVVVLTPPRHDLDYAIELLMALSVLGGTLLFHIVEKPARHCLRRHIDRRWPGSV